MEKGMKKGMKKGIAQGSRDTLVKTVIEMLKNNIEIDMISKISKMSIDEIKEIEKNIQN